MLVNHMLITLHLTTLMMLLPVNHKHELLNK